MLIPFNSQASGILKHGFLRPSLPSQTKTRPKKDFHVHVTGYSLNIRILIEHAVLSHVSFFSFSARNLCFSEAFCVRIPNSEFGAEVRPIILIARTRSPKLLGRGFVRVSDPAIFEENSRIGNLTFPKFLMVLREVSSSDPAWKKEYLLSHPEYPILDE